MTKQVQFRRGNAIEHSTFIGAEGEVTVNTTTNTLVVHDGVTAGGHPVGSSSVSGSVSFDTVAALKLSSTAAGSIVSTSGYYASGDAGAATYLIKTAADFGATPDGWGDHTLANGNVAVLLNQGSGYVKASQYGGAQSDVTKDTPAVQAMIDAGLTGVYIDPGVQHELLGLTVNSTQKFEITGAGPLESIIKCSGKVITYNNGGTDPGDHLGNIASNVGFYVVADCTDGIIHTVGCRNWNIEFCEVVVGIDGAEPNLNGSHAAEWIGHWLKIDNGYQCSIRNCLGRWHGGAMLEIGDWTGYYGVSDTIHIDTVTWAGNYGMFTRAGIAELHNIQFTNVKFRDSVNSAENPYGEWEGATPRPLNWDNAEHGETYITQDVLAGDTTLVVNDISQLNLGNLTTDNLLYIGRGNTAEQVRVASVSGNNITLATPFRFDHTATISDTSQGDPVIFAPVYVTMQSVQDVHITNLHLERCWIGFHMMGVKGVRYYGGNTGAKYVFRLEGKCRDWNIAGGTHPGNHYIDFYLLHVPAYHSMNGTAYNWIENIAIDGVIHNTDPATGEIKNFKYVAIDNWTRDAKQEFLYRAGGTKRVYNYGTDASVFTESTSEAFIEITYGNPTINVTDGQVIGQFVTIHLVQMGGGGRAITGFSSNVTLARAWDGTAAAGTSDTIVLTWQEDGTWHEVTRILG